MATLGERISIELPVHDRQKAEISFLDLEERISKDSELANLQDHIAKPQVRGMLNGIFGASPYLTDLILRNPSSLAECLGSDPSEYLDALCQGLVEKMAHTETLEAAMRCLRIYKQNIALLTALADLADVWDIMTTTEALTKAADTVLTAAVRFLLCQAMKKGDYLPVDPDQPEEGSGYIVLAMGKHGAYELNYSSDIDLIVFYDPQCPQVREGLELGPFFVKITRDLVRLLQERTADGYVFRTDLRLRPDPGATQVAISTDAGLVYYESAGQNWERAALIKARIVAGDQVAGNAFLEQLAPFIWRKYLDFAAIADVHAMKRQIHAFKGHGKIALEGHNIKLGRGGIREIEFFAQTQQLIAGGRQVELRTPRTLDALQMLAEKGWVSEDVTVSLSKSYRFLRRIEHRLQMIADEQTHNLPKDEQSLARIAQFSGFADIPAFAETLTAHLQSVQDHYAALFETVPDLSSEGGNLVFTGDDNDPGTLETLTQMGFSEPAKVISTVKAWHHGRYPAMRSARARERLTELHPVLLDALSKTVEPDAALLAFDKFLADLPAGVQLFSLLRNNPYLLRLIADIMGTAPRLARVLSRRSRMLDAVIDPGFFGVEPAEEVLHKLIDQALRGSEDFQEYLDRARIVGQEQAFLIGVRILSGSIGAAQAGGAFALLAEQLIKSLKAEAEQEIARVHGVLDGGSAAVLAMGKLGGHEMTANSDLDLIVIYDFDEKCEMSNGAKPLAASQYYARFTQRLISALSAPTAEGSLYEVDMRLRPSGKSGPVATRLGSFIDYQKNQAWTWEHMALTRARVISAPDPLKGHIEETIRTVLCQPRNAAKVASDIVEMRERIAKEHKTDNVWHIKHVRGGHVDLEFITQYLQLIHVVDHPNILDQNTEAALQKLADADLIDAEAAEMLIPAAQLYHNLTQILRLCVDDRFSPDSISEGLKVLLMRVGEAPDFDRLEARLAETLSNVKRFYDRVIAVRV